MCLADRPIPEVQLVLLCSGCNCFSSLSAVFRALILAAVTVINGLSRYNGFGRAAETRRFDRKLCRRTVEEYP
jgi:hypothetical protein